MTNKNRKTLLLAAVLVTLPYLLHAQTNGSNSPYSRYGFGLLSDQANGFNKGMGGVAMGMRSNDQLNSQNPASYSAIDSLTFLLDFGMSLQKTNFSQGGTKINANNTSIDYLNIGFRAWRNVGVSLGLMPFSTVGYNTSSTQAMESIDGLERQTTTTTYSGDGGLHYAYIGIGWKPLTAFSIGTNLSYLWGDYSHTTQSSFSDSYIQPLRRNYQANISTYKIDFGIQYEQKINARNYLVWGATYGIGHPIAAQAQFISQRLTYNNGSVESGDTIRTSNAFELPHSFGIGLTWLYKNSLRLGFDYTTQLWKNAKFPELGNAPDGTPTYQPRKGAFSNRHHFAIGAEYYPNRFGVRYRDHILYRAGFSYTTPYTNINGQSGANNYCVSMGIGIPIINNYNNRSILNISAQWEHVSPKMSHMITENYFRLCVGLTFNERWFMKWKVK